jgi:small subunit ribosomal protein S17
MTQAPPTSPTPGFAPAPRALRGILLGVVTSDKRNKTRTVAVAYQVRHPKYGKYLHRQTRYQVHDEANASKLGDKVQIANCRPISKTKSWRLLKVVESAPAPVEHVTEVKTA